jgi:hypothetical protein
MNAPSFNASASVYAIQLLVPGPQGPPGPDGLAGRLEHVLSGRRHDFANGPALLACLAFEQQQAALDDAAARHLSSPPP